MSTNGLIRANTLGRSPLATGAQPAHAELTDIADGGLTCVPGLTAAAVATGVKPDDALDLALILADGPRPWTAAGVFTRNAAAAAPVELCRARLAKRRAARAIVINSGNANALTGEQGRRDALAMAERAEARCGGPALVLSTGVIGEPLPIERVLDGIDRAASSSPSSARGAELSQAILTTDTYPKVHATVVELTDAGTTVTVGGVAKGSGMIHPDMATMLAVIGTDAPLGGDAADELLRSAVDASFHEISVDGDTSTNDTVLLLARAPNDRCGPLTDGADMERLARAITHVARSLAEQIVFDGEGASRVLEVRVEGAGTRGEAKKVADSVCRSALVKTALAGGDPNWGRIVSAAGAADVPLDPDAIELRIEGHAVYSRGAVGTVSEDVLRAAFSARRVQISLDLGRAKPGPES